MEQHAVSRDDLRHVLQATLESKQLDRFLHPELPGRKPLVVLINDVVDGSFTLTKFGQPVRYVSRDELPSLKGAYLEFSRIEVDDNTVRVLHVYPVEGIRAVATFVRSGGAWHGTDYKIHEK